MVAEIIKQRGNWLLGGLVAVYALLVGINAVTRLSPFYYIPDAMNYVDVASNILNGNGITQSTIGFNEPVFPVVDAAPVPITSQPPFYPMVVAAVSALGIPPTVSGVIISILAFGSIMLLLNRIMTLLYDQTCGLLTVTLLLAYQPLTITIGKTASDLFGLTLVCASLWVLLSGIRSDRAPSWLLFVAGIFAGLAFSTRYIFVLWILTGTAAIVFESKRKLSHLLWFLAGWVVPAGLVWARNWVLLNALMPTPNPSTVGLLSNVTAFFWAITGEFSTIMPREIQALAFGSVVGGLILVLAGRDGLRNGLQDLLIRRGRWILLTWMLLYTVYLIGTRTILHFDWINSRLTLPVGVFVVAFIAALLSRVTRPGYAQVLILTSVLACALIIQQVFILVVTPVFDHDQWMALSERLSWIKDNTTDSDLVIGNDAQDVRFHLNRPIVASFSYYPYTNYLGYEQLLGFCQKNSTKFTHFYLVISKQYQTEAEWRGAYGRFIADIVWGRLESYPKVHQLGELQDAYIYEIDP